MKASAKFVRQPGGHGGAQLEQRRRFLQLVQGREDQVLLAIDGFEPDRGIVGQPVRHLAIGPIKLASQGLQQGLRMGRQSQRAADNRPHRFPFRLRQQVRPRIGIAPARFGKHVAPVQGGFQLIQQAKGVGT